MLLDGQTMHLVPCDENLMGHKSQKLNIGMIRLHIQTQLPLKQLSGLPSPRSQSTNLFLYKMIEHLYLLILFPKI